ncbi:uncharacterized protein UTRI_06037 [Ustilago trichophora]|uniref:Beta-xylosidase n=1 Tax=Ustilago trichophora TaxID=86804 RepID=A0A5C3EF27_9BASI|nr:uncharacterized protein UTRI_06037 [Ustilago trichophora]
MLRYTKAVMAFVSMAFAATRDSGAISLGGQGYVDLSVYGGVPAHLGAGILYGLPDGPAFSPDSAPTLPSTLFPGAGINFERAGGAQIPFAGYNGGNITGYKERFQSTLQNYQYATARGAKFVLLPHDLWGADAATASTNVYPCDNNDCSQYGVFLEMLISDLKSNNMLPGLHIDLWNEPDGYNFWPRSQDQYLQAYAYAYNKYRAAFGDNVPLQGPTAAEPANAASTWWQNWAQYVRANNVVPDIYAYHQLSGRGSPNCGNDPVESNAQLQQIKKTYGLPDRPVQINEYAGSDEQTPAYTAWFIGRFERTGITGLRANWGSGKGLHDDLARLLLVSNNYQTFDKMGDWHVFNYYTQSQPGLITLAGATGSSCYDLYVTQDRSANQVHILAGTRGQDGPYPITVSNVNNMPGFQGKSSLRALVKEIPYNNAGVVNAPNVLFNSSVSVNNNQLFYNLTMNTDSAYTIDLFAD